MENVYNIFKLYYFNRRKTIYKKLFLLFLKILSLANVMYWNTLDMCSKGLPLVHNSVVKFITIMNLVYLGEKTK